MKWLYLLLVIFVLIFDCKAQTNVISVNVGDYGLQPLSNRVTLNLIYPNPRIYKNTLISQSPISITTSNGVGRFTNIIWGQYRVDVDTVPVTKFLVNVNTNSTGNITLASLVTGPEVFPTQTTNAYYTNYFQTNVIMVNIADYGLAPQSMRITLTLISPNPRTYNNYLISSTPISTVTGTNGIGYFTNLIWGQYRADLSSTPVTKFMINVNTNSIGSVSFVSLITDTAALPPNPTTNYYNQAQIDSLLSAIKAGVGVTNAYATNIAGVLVTNQNIYISTNYASTSITNGLATTNYVLAQSFVTASVTNGLATTNYVNAATNGFVTASITNGLATTNYANAVGTTVSNGVVNFVTNNYISTIQGTAISNSLLLSISATNTANLVITTNLIENKTNFASITATNNSTFLSNLTIKSNAIVNGTIYVTNVSTEVVAKLSGTQLAFNRDSASFGTIISPDEITIYSRAAGGNIFSASSSNVNTGTVYANNLTVNNAGPEVNQGIYALDVAKSGAYNYSYELGNSSGDFDLVGGENFNDISYSVNVKGGPGHNGFGGGSVNIQGGSETAGSFSVSSITLTGATTSQAGTISVTGDTTFNSALTVNGKALFTNDVILSKGNLYVTNHAYDVSTSQLDPAANEFVTASFVRSVLNNGAFLYGTTNTIAVGFSNILTSSTNKISLQFGLNAPAGYTKGFTNFVTGTYPNGPYFASIVSTNTYQAVTGPFVNDFYIQADGSGAGHALGITPDIFVTYDLTNLIPICAGAEQSLTMAATTNLYTWIQSAAQYNSTNTAGFYIVRRVRVTSQNGNNLYINVKGGSGTATTLAFNTPVTINANYVGTFIGNGSGLTNIPATGIVGTAVTNNSSPTLTGLVIGSQTAIDSTGNGLFGGVNQTNGVIAGNGIGITNIVSTNVVTANGTNVSTGSATNYTVNLLSGPSGNLQQIYLANTNCYITFTGTNIADSTRSVLFRGWTNTAISLLSFNLTRYHTNAFISFSVTNGWSAIFNFYNPDTTGTNVMISDGGRWK
tara:strand:- start:1617 stop:4679 length:3063 start_codon:yes stop_codon:yes gene_type:complete